MSTVNIRSESIRIISSMAPLDHLEQEHIDLVLHWIESGSEIFRIEEPATPETHLVAYLDYDLHEFNQIRWFEIDKIPFEKSDPHMKRFIQKMLSQAVLKIY